MTRLWWWWNRLIAGQGVMVCWKNLIQSFFSLSEGLNIGGIILYVLAIPLLLLYPILQVPATWLVSFSCLQLSQHVVGVTLVHSSRLGQLCGVLVVWIRVSMEVCAWLVCWPPPRDRGLGPGTWEEPAADGVLHVSCHLTSHFCLCWLSANWAYLRRVSCSPARGHFRSSASKASNYNNELPAPDWVEL